MTLLRLKGAEQGAQIGRRIDFPCDRLAACRMLKFEPLRMQRLAGECSKYRVGAASQAETACA